MAYMFTSQKAINKAFRESFPELDFTKIKDHAGDGTMYKCDTRVAFVDYVDMLQRDGLISDKLANKVTLK